MTRRTLESVPDSQHGRIESATVRRSDPDLVREASAAIAFLDALGAAVDAVVFLADARGRVLWTNQKLVEPAGPSGDGPARSGTGSPFLQLDDLPQLGRAFDEFVASSSRSSPAVDDEVPDRLGGVRRYRSRVARVMWGELPAFVVVATPTYGRLVAGPPAVDARYSRLVENAQDGIVSLGADGVIRFANRRFVQLAKRDFPSLGLYRLWQLFHPDERDTVRERLLGMDAEQGPNRFEARLRASDGEERLVDVIVSRLPRGSDDGALMAVVRDITESRRLAERVRRAQKAQELGALASGVAHDFNNLIGAILGNVSLAQDSLVAGAPVDAMLADILLAARRAGALSSAMLQYIGQAHTRFDVVDVVPLLHAMKSLVGAALPRHLRLDVSTAGAALLVMADARQLRQAVTNLIVNAAEATDGPSVVRIESLAEDVRGDDGDEWMPEPPPVGPAVKIRVVDHGRGMEPEHRRRMFDPFFTTKSTGRGLGLSAVLGIVRAHGGAVRVLSRPGGGTVAEIVLSRATVKSSTSLTRPTAPAVQEQRPGKLSVLFVDDDDLMRRLGREILVAAGFDVRLASDGETAIALVEQNPRKFDVVVMDHSMPGMGGLRAAALLRGIRNDLPVLLISGYGEEARPDGIPFLPKPFGAQDLIAEVTKLGRGKARLA